MSQFRHCVRAAFWVPALPLLLSAANAQTPATWRVAPTPVFMVGGTDAPGETFNVISGAIKLQDGRYAVADGKDLHISVYDHNGRQLSRFGRRGAGPGEFIWLSGIWSAGGDTIGAYDSSQRRITRFLPDGKVVSVHPLKVPTNPSPAPGNLDAFMAAFADGSIVLCWIAAERAQPGQYMTDRMSFGLFSRHGEFQQVLGAQTGMIRTVIPGRGGSPIAFSPFPYATAAGNYFVYSNGLQAELSLYDVRGEAALARRINVPGRAIPLSEAWRALDQVADDAAPGPSIDVARAMDRSYGSVPHFARMITDDAGRIWLKEYDPRRDSIPMRRSRLVPGGRYRVVRTDGVVVATIALPDNVSPIAAYGDQLLTVTLDDLDVEHFAVYRIMR
jgi:hypothetical protein